MAVAATKSTYEAEVLKSEVPVVVDFWAAWCGPCRMIAPIIDQLADEYEGKLKVGKVNVDEQGQLAAQYGVMSIPTLVFFKNGEEVERVVGVRPKPELDKIIQKVM